MWESLCGHMLSLLLAKYLGVDWLGHMVKVCLTWKKLPTHFPKWMDHVTFPPPHVRFQSLPASAWRVLLISDIPIGVWCSLVSVCISLVTNDIILMYHSYFFFGEVCSIPFPMGTQKTGLFAFFLLILKVFFFFFNIPDSSLLSDM